MALAKQTVHIPFGRGLDTGKDPRALELPALAVCRDAEFEEAGGLQTRKPFGNMSVNILGGGALSDIRKVVANGDELVAFTESAVYSWSPSESAWVLRGTHLAVAVDEASRFVNTAEQNICERAELDGIALFAWEQTTSSTTNLYMAAQDTVTGAVIVAPTLIGSGYTRPRLLAMGDHFLAFFCEASATKLWCGNVRPTAIATDLASLNELTIIATASTSYDVEKLSATTAVVAVRTAAGYTVGTVTSAAGAGSAPTFSGANKARTAALIAVAAAPNGTHVQIVRADEGSLPATSIVGDYLSIAGPYTDVTTGQAIGDSTGQTANLTAAYRSETNGGEYRCYAYWNDETADYTSFYARSNYVDTGGTIGTATSTATRFVNRLSIASRAFEHGGSVYVWLCFAGQSDISSVSGLRAQLQNTFFLYRDDGFLVAKASPASAGGHAIVSRRGRVPNVQHLGGNRYAWCGVERRVIPVGVGPQANYAARAPREIVFEFDSDKARRAARLGRTLYIAGGEALQYDGQGLYEVGFHVYPYRFSGAASSTGGVEDGDYTYRLTWRWDNAQGERDRSTTATHITVTVSSGPDDVTISGVPPLTVTHKTTNPPAVEGWRTPVNPTIESPYYLVTGNDPATTTGDNPYVPNDPTSSGLSFVDSYADSTLITKETNPENGSILENLAPPAAKIVAASDERLFLAGVAGEPHLVAYSKKRGPGEVAAFHDTLTVELPPEGGPVAALAFLDETLVAFKETAIYALPGEGFDNAGGGQNYGPSRRMSADVGAVSAEAIGATPAGLMFKSRKGWYMLLRNGAVEYIGDPVSEFDDDEVKAVHVVEAQHHVRVLTDQRMLVFDYKAGQWAEWTIADGVSACVWDGTYVYCTSTEVKAERETFEDLSYGLDVETPWIPLAGPGGLQGFGGIWGVQALGEFRSACDLRWRIAYDYEESDADGPTWVDDKFQTITQTTVGGPVQLRHGPRRARCQAIKVRLTTYATGSTTTPPTGEGLKLTSLALSFGVESQSLYRRMPAVAKQ